MEPKLSVHSAWLLHTFCASSFHTIWTLFMRETQPTFPELGLIAATRGLIGAGIGFLLAERIPESPRKAIGWTLLSIGALSTIPLALTVFGRSHCAAGTESSHRQGHREKSKSDDQVGEPSVAVGI